MPGPPEPDSYQYRDPDGYTHINPVEYIYVDSDIDLYHGPFGYKNGDPFGYQNVDSICDGDTYLRPSQLHQRQHLSGWSWTARRTLGSFRRRRWLSIGRQSDRHQVRLLPIRL
jgi:hypothetical protein